MVLDSVLKNLVMQSAERYSSEERIKDEAKQVIDRYKRKTAATRLGWFERAYLPVKSVLAKMSHEDRVAVLAHFRARELRIIADAMRNGASYSAQLARKRLDHVQLMTRVFAEIEQEGWPTQ